MKLATAFVATLLSATNGHAEDIRVETFQRVCLDARASYAASATAAESLGWTPTTESVRSELQQVFAISRGFEFEDGAMTELQAYRHSNHPSIFVALSEVTFRDHLLNGCYVYDFDAAEAIPNNVFEGLVGSQANEAIYQPGIISVQKWVGPEAFPGVATLRVAFISAESEAAEAAGFDGVALAITSFSSSEAEGAER